MKTEPDPREAERRWRTAELGFLVCLAVLGTALFWATDLDVALVRPFYRPEGPDPWPLAGRWAFRVLYRSAPWLTAGLALAGSALLVAGLARRGSRRMRLYGLFIMLSVALGPGLLVNGVFKEHWGRPRPRQVQALGGTYPYVPPLLRAATPGQSFPCGHCSVAYLYALGFWIWRRRRPGLAAASLGAGLTLGTLTGVGRLAAGGHFPSDVLWSGLIAFGVAHGLYHHVLRIPEGETAARPIFHRIERDPRRRALAVGLAVLLGAAVVGAGILASPQFLDLGGRRALEAGPPRPEVLEVLLDRADLELRLVAGPGGWLAGAGWVHGFGLPTNTIRAEWSWEPAPVPTLRYRLTERGWFTDIDGRLRLDVPRNAFRRIRVRVGEGDVRVLAVPRDSPAPLPDLDVRTGRGTVEGPR